MAPTLCALLASAAALSAAKADLDQGRPAQVLVDLDGPDAVAPAESPEAAKLLTAAAEAAKASGDAPLALQLAQRAARVDPAQAAPVRLLAEWSLADHEFGAARRYGDRWARLAPQDEAQLRFQRRLALLEQDWHPGEPAKQRRRERDPAGTAAADRPRAASAAPPGRTPAAPPVAPDATQAVRPAPAPDAAGGHRIVLYGDAHSRACEEARKWLRARKLAFTDRDIEADRLAALELKTKERAAGGGFRGLPIVEIDGRLLAGFSAADWETALAGR